MNALHLLFGSSVIALLAACTGVTDPSEPVDEAADEVVGVEDLNALEKELGLVKDVAGPHGFTRDVTKGACFKKGKAQSPRWQFRRYKNGAVFFRPESSEPGQGPSRPVLCLDVDARRDGGVETMGLERFEIDAAARYKLGKLGGIDGALGGERALSFAGGFLDGHSREFLCGAVDLRQTSVITDGVAWLEAGVVANEACRHGGGSVEACDRKAINACENAAKKSSGRLDERLIANELGTPDIEVERLVIGGGKEVDAVVASVVARYTVKKARSANVFDMDQDPVGRFVDVDVAGGFTHVRYGRLDVHHRVDAHQELVVITPKSSDQKIKASAIVSCKRASKADRFDCEDPGKPLAP